MDHVPSTLALVIHDSGKGNPQPLTYPQGRSALGFSPALTAPSGRAASEKDSEEPGEQLPPTLIIFPRATPALQKEPGQFGEYKACHFLLLKREQQKTFL